MTRMHCRFIAAVLLGAIASAAAAHAQQAQPITISGRVSNETGQPMPGASVALIGLVDGRTALPLREILNACEAVEMRQR